MLTAVDSCMDGSLRKEWTPTECGATLIFELTMPEFLTGMWVSATSRCAFAVEYSNQGGAGEAVQTVEDA